MVKMVIENINLRANEEVNGI